MSRYLITIIWLIATLLVPEVVAGEEKPYPDSKAGKWLQEFMVAIESGKHEDFARRALSPQVTDDFPPESLMDFMRQVKMMHGGFVFHAFPKSSEFEIVAIGRGRESEMWRRLEITVEAKPPHRLVGLGIDEAESPEGAGPELAQMSEAEILSYVDEELSHMEAEDKFSGAILIARHDEPLMEKAYGMASRRFSVPNRTDTKFNIGSINKTFTQLAVAQLMQQGKIDRSDKISKFLPDFPRERANKITVEHLITMRSGLSHYWTPEYNSKWPEIRTVGALMEIIREQPLDFEPGTSQQYSNSGYVVLGAIIESVTGQDYYDYVRDHIFKPAGMTSTDSYPIDQTVPNLAIGYTTNRTDGQYAGQHQNNLLLHGVMGSPAGGGYSTLRDLWKYTRALRNNELADERHTNLVLGIFQNLDNANRRPPYFGIAGGAPIGVCALLESDFETGYTVVVLSNCDPPTAERFGLKVMRMLRNQSDV